MSQALFGPESAVVAPNMAPSGTKKALHKEARGL